MAGIVRTINQRKAMATLYKHGSEIGRIEYLTGTAAYMSDGKILRNDGDGWKRWRKVKPEITPEEAFRKSTESHDRLLRERPALAEYRKLLHGFCSNGKRALVHCSVEMLGNDHDGIWSEINDMIGVSASFDDVAELCNAYDAMIREKDSLAKV